MTWIVEFHPEFKSEFFELSTPVRAEIAVKAEMLEILGPVLKRPHADTLNGSKYANMKELRFKAEGGVWRVAYAFDPARKAILLVAGNKAGTNEWRFYKELLTKADTRFAAHLAQLKRRLQ